MPLKIGCNNGERDLLVATLAATKDWEEAKAAVPNVDPKVLDSGFKEWAHKKAGVPLPKEPEKGKPDPLK